ncbi:MAG: hypothetical protein HYU86_01955 [Chloroflexi bacterium]|nr:hypothetical protein [Chloroflexota bacterium]
MAEMGCTDDLKGRIDLCNALQMDFLGIPVSWRETDGAAYSYRCFTLEKVAEAVHTSNLPVAAVVDGPFSRLIAQKGLLELLREKGHDAGALSKALKEVEEDEIPLGELVTGCAQAGAKLVVIADDLAYNQTTYLQPAHMRQALFPCYAGLVSRIHELSLYALIHSDGNLTRIVPELIACGFDGILCQSDCPEMNVAFLKERYRDSLIWFTGIGADLLSASHLDEQSLSCFMTQVRDMVRDGHLVLSSCVGLFEPASVRQLEQVYAWLAGT